VDADLRDLPVQVRAVLVPLIPQVVKNGLVGHSTGPFSWGVATTVAQEMGGRECFLAASGRLAVVAVDELRRLAGLTRTVTVSRCTS
jgi:hypothetical protein